MKLLGQTVKFRGTITNLRISAVNGTAFIDNAGATIPTYADGNHLIEIYDASGRMLKGVLKEAGTEETYTDLVTGDNSTFASDTGWWGKDAEWTIPGDGFAYVNNVSGVNKYLYKVALMTSLVLHKTTGTYVFTSGSITVQASGDTATYSTDGIKTVYATNVVSGNFGFKVATGTVATLDDVILEKVLTPSTSGCTIVTLKAGTVFNFAYKDVNFTYNAASYFCIVRALR